MCKAMCAPKSCAINGFVGAVLCFGLLIFAITEKVRYTTLDRPLECEPPAAVGTRLSGISAPSPLAEALGLAPGNAPFGLYFNLTTKTRCTNPGPATITMKSSAYDIRVLIPNYTDLELGGGGLNYSLAATTRLVRDATIHEGGGQDELVVELQWAQPLEDLLATMTPANTMRGFTLGFSTSSQTLTTCSRLLFLTTCLDTPVEQFCGSYSGPCLEKTLDASGEPVPGQFEPAICVYSKSLCGKEADVKAQITPEALGVNILSEAPCTPATGLPNTSMCNAVSSLGVDPQTMLPRTIDPMVVLTPEAQAELDATLATAESTVNLMLDIAIALYVILTFANLLQGVFSCRKHRRLMREADGVAKP